MVEAVGHQFLHPTHLLFSESACFRLYWISLSIKALVLESCQHVAETVIQNTCQTIQDHKEQGKEADRLRAIMRQLLHS